MPELPEVETIAAGLREQLAGQRCTGLTAKWKPIFQPSFNAVRRAVVGRRLAAITRHGKFLFLHFDSGDTSSGKILLSLHLRMTGQIFTRPEYQPDKHVHAVFSFGERRIWWRDIRKFGRIALVPAGAPPLPAHIGPDMLTIDFESWWQRLAGRRAPLKNLLLDQSIASGIGNIYADEALFRAGLHPRATPVSLAEPQLRRLYRGLRGVLKLAIRHHGTTFSDFVDFSGRPGNFRRKLQIYGRRGEPCRRCGTPIERIKLAGRSAHFCPQCQAAPAGAGQPSTIGAGKSPPG